MQPRLLADRDIVFVYGALRSGTTVFRLMLDAHPDIANPGEMDFLFDYLHPNAAAPDGWRYDLDGLCKNRIFKAKALDLMDGLDGLALLSNLLHQIRDRSEGLVLSINLHRHVDIAHKVLPGVRFIHMLRDPRDIARSSIAMGWAGTLYHGVDHWIGTEIAWDAANVDDSKALTLRYEDLIAAPEAHLADVCAFIEVPFIPAMLAYHENTSYAPPDASLTFQWKKKADRRDIAQLESRTADLMGRRGYKPVSDAVRPTALARAYLALQNKTAIWKFGLKRFGAPIYLGEKVTRVFRMTRLNQSLRQKKQNIVKLHLK